MVELLAVREGVRLATYRLLDHVIIESDYLQVVQAIRHRSQGYSLMDLLVDDIHALLRGFVDSHVRYVWRTANGVAHNMAKLVVSFYEDFCWFEEPPDVIVEPLSHDV